MQITKDELVKELAEMECQYGRRRKFAKLNYSQTLAYIVEAERFIRAINNIRRRKTNGRKTNITNIPTV